MKSLTQKLKDGIVEVLEVPLPLFGSGEVLVRNVFSLISAGTESSTVSAARKSLIGKAKERPQQVRQVLDVLVQQGPVQAYRAVMKKLDAWSPLGYSCVGEVIDLASDVSGFKIGDWVACGGLTAVITDFKELSVYGDGRPFRKKLFSQDKGQKDMVRAFVEVVRAGGAAPIPFEDIYAVTLTTFKIMESLQKRQAVGLNLKSVTVI